jgi:membrane protease subunit HflK
MDSEELRRLKEALPKFDLRIVKWVIVAVVVLLGIATSIYTIPTESVGVVTRFGAKMESVVGPGLKLKLPFFIDRVVKVPVRRQLKQEFGFGTNGGTNESQYSNSARDREDEKSMVTGDLNAALVEWVVQYHIEDPAEYLFKVRNPDGTLRAASESIMREVIGDRTVDEVITIGRQDINRVAKEKLQTLIDAYEIGLLIDQIQLKNVDPPLPVQASFNEVNEAQQEREQQINVAWGQYNKVIPQAKGDADRKISEAEGYATERVNEAEGDAARFNLVFAEYLKAPEVTRRRLYLEAMEETLPAIGRKIILDDDVKGMLPFLQIDPDAGKGGLR